MAMKNQLAKAIAIAAEAHAEQIDKVGLPYILHPLRVMLAVGSPLDRLVALLHDVVEDTEMTLDGIRLEFGDVVAGAVDAITKRKGEEYEAYIARVKENPCARRVKIADVKDNAGVERLSLLGLEDSVRLIRKYTYALHELKEEL